MTEAPKKAEAPERGLKLLRRNWHGYDVWESATMPGTLLWLVDMDGNVGLFNAGDRKWADLEDLLGLVWEDIHTGRIQWD